MLFLYRAFQGHTTFLKVHLSYLSTGVRPKVGGEAKGLVDGQVGLHHEHGGAGGLCLLEHVTTTPFLNSVDTAHGVLRALGGD